VKAAVRDDYDRRLSTVFIFNAKYASVCELILRKIIKIVATRCQILRL